jgi:septal ring-binding cell division protein DamX
MTDFYQSPADKLRFEILLKSLREGSLNLAIVGSDEVALASYGRQIYDHLVDIGESHVEWWNSADSEKLVQRFNDILAELTVDEALDKSQKRAPKRYMIFPDTHAIQPFELQLLARLINGFPTSNINLVLVVNQQDAYEEKLSVFGKNLLQWILESETPAQAYSAKESSTDRSNRYAQSSVQDDERIYGAQAKDSRDAVADFSATFAATLASGKFPNPSKGDVDTGSDLHDPLMDVPAQSVSGERAQSNAPAATKGSLSTKVAGILIFAIVASVVSLSLIYQDEVLKQAKSLEDFVSGKKPASAKAADKNQKSASQEGAGTGAADTTESSKNDVGAGNKADASSAPSTAEGANSANGGNVSANSNANSPALGMSSTAHLPVKTDDSLIANKEEVISPAPALKPTQLTPKEASSQVAQIKVQTPNSVTPTQPSVAPAPAASNSTRADEKQGATQNKADSKVDAKSDTKVEAKNESKTANDVKRDAKPALDAQQSKSEQKSAANSAGPVQVPKARDASVPKELKETKETKETRDARESKPGSKQANAARETENLPKLAPRADKSDRSEEGKPKSSNAETQSGFKPRAEDLRFVQQLPDESWVMQHAALDTYEEALSFQQSSPFYKDARVMYTKRRDAAPYYIVVTGPYSSRQDAEAETRKHPIMVKSWVRSAKSLKNQYDE